MTEFSAATLLGFIATSIALALSPGPDNIYVITQSLTAGVRRGLCITLGLCSGLVLHTALASAGVSAIIMGHRYGLLAVKILGVSYLVYLSWQLFRSRPESVLADDISKTRSTETTVIYYRRGLIMNLSNPKVAIFFIAFLPQFADIQRDDLPVQLAVLGSIFIACALGVFSVLALLASQVGQRVLGSAGQLRMLHRATAVLFLALALRLALY